MALIHWEPFRSVDDIFNRMMPSPFGSRRFPFESNLEAEREWLPAADIGETDNEYPIRTELPAVRKEDVHVKTKGGLITIEGERKRQQQKNERLHRMESYYGSFSRTFTLPEKATMDAIRFEAKEGVLTVHIPKKTVEKTQPREI